MSTTAAPLLDELRREADAAIEARLTAARAEAAHLEEAADAEREQRRRGAVTARERELASGRERARSEATASTVAAVLVARAAFLQRVFARAEAKLEQLPGSPDFATRFAPLLRGALPFVAADEARVRCASRAVAVVRDVLDAAGSSGIEVVEDASIPAGARIEDKRGTMCVDATLVALLRRMEQELAIEVVHSMEGGDR